jgi:hypothetical protein
MITRGQFNIAVTGIPGSTLALSGSSQTSGAPGYEVLPSTLQLPVPAALTRTSPSWPPRDTVLPSFHSPRTSHMCNQFKCIFWSAGIPMSQALNCVLLLSFYILIRSCQACT